MKTRNLVLVGSAAVLILIFSSIMLFRSAENSAPQGVLIGSDVPLAIITDTVTGGSRSSENMTSATTTVEESPKPYFRYKHIPQNEFEQAAFLLAEQTIGSSGVDNEWALFLVGKTSPLPAGYQVETEMITDWQSLDTRCAEYAALMLRAAEIDGAPLIVSSAFRSVERQQENFDNLYSEYLSEGYSENEAHWITASVIQPPGQSEHNAGVSMDVISPDWFNTHSALTNDFANTMQYEWLVENSWKYGFILRYPKDKQDITGIIYESWHYRFVGLYHAEQIAESGLCLEEYIGEFLI